LGVAVANRISKQKGSVALIDAEGR
jgi:hypothetical protein